jgi:hypothetical protein
MRDASSTEKKLSEESSTLTPGAFTARKVPRASDEGN